MPDSLDGELLKALLDEASLPRAVQGIAANLVERLNCFRFVLLIFPGRPGGQLEGAVSIEGISLAFSPVSLSRCELASDVNIINL